MKYLMMACVLLCSPNLLASQNIARCAAIKSAVERLDCYDRMARGEQSNDTRQHAGPEAPATTVTDTPVKPGAAATAPRERTTDIPEQPSHSVDEEAFVKKFGERHSDISEGDSISSSIDKVDRNNRRLYVMKLNNGQVWMQREPGDRPIRAGQPVTITRKRWSYAMFLQDQNFEVTVQRID